MKRFVSQSMLCAPHLLFTSRLAAPAWSLGSSPASKAAQAAPDSPKRDSKHWALHRANTQQPTGTSQRQGRHSVQLTQLAIFTLLATTSRMFCGRLTSLPSSDLWQAINFSSLPESGQSRCVPHPHGEGSRAQPRHRLSPCQLLPLSATGSAQGQACAAKWALQPREHLPFPRLPSHACTSNSAASHGNPTLPLSLRVLDSHSQQRRPFLFSSCSSSATEPLFRAFCVLLLWSLPLPCVFLERQMKG